ncbi:DUF6907 domain-containing protein [Streptomyces coelicoflavus]|uniref:DUF6907 domain-containing protein n=1 Tax=Streptomyces coelicoflavus TaxID=285562 RepID=UPI0036BC334F
MAQSAITQHAAAIAAAAIPQQPTAATVHPFPAVKPGFRLVPAKVGATNRTSTVVYIECPNWCTEDHVENAVRNVEDILHCTGTEGFVVETFTGDTSFPGAPGWVHGLWAGLESDPAATDSDMRRAHVVVEDGSNYAYLTPQMAEQLADTVVGFASELRHLARTARLHNSVESGDSDPDMDEALRRVRGEAV